MKKVLISDPTLRDGNHAIGHKLTAENVAKYSKAADEAGVPIIEVGHGNGIGASSFQVGIASVDDKTLLKAAKDSLKKSKLGIHSIPGFSTIERDIKPAIDGGVEVFRIACHCTEADITEKHISYLRNKSITVYGVLMMSHMASVQILVEESKKMEAYGAEGIIFMDSAGAYLPKDVSDRTSALVDALEIPVGFHGHNNLGMAIANSISAVESGATIIDGTIKGFGAGAGNTQLEVLVAVFEKLGFETGINLYKILDAADIAEREFVPNAPTISPVSVVSGLSGVFSGFNKHVNRISKEMNVDPRDVFFELGKRKAVAGQEDMIIEVARELAKK